MVWSVQLLPLQVGPPSEYARSQRITVGCVVTAQLFLCIVSIFEFVDVFGGIVLGFAVFFGYLGWLHNMNITYVVIWGCFSIVHFLYASIAASLIMIIDAVTFRFSTMLTHMLVCVASLVAAALSWRIYADFENEAPRPDLLGQFLIGVGVLHSPDETAPLMSRDPNAMMAGMAAKNMGAQITGGPQQSPAGMMAGLFGGFSPPATDHLQVQGTAAANQHAAQARSGLGAAQAQGQAAQAQGQAGLAGLFGELLGSAPDTSHLEAQGTAAANQHAAQARAGMGAAQLQGQANLTAAQAQGQANLASAQAQGQAGLLGAQGWFANVQQQVNSGEQLGAMRDPFGVAGPPPPAGAAGNSNVAVDPFLTNARPH